MSKHTPGPWVWYRKLSGSENSRGFGIAQEGKRFAIVDVYPLDEDGVAGEANARLMAAAPELLEALEEVVAEATAYEARHGEMRRPWVRKARAAIAKAKGES